METKGNAWASNDLAGWMPFGIRWEGSGAQIDWCYVGRNRFTDPFFDQTIQRCREGGNAGGNRVTSFDALDDFPIVRAPAGFIFHTSHCGSTLVSQMLASVPRFIAISEANILASILRPAAQIFEKDDGQQIRLLRKIVNVLAQSRTERDTRCFIKFSSKSMLDFPVIQRAFPDVPWVFLYREPLEVMSALLRSRSDTLPPGLLESGLLDDDAEIVRAMQPAEFWTRVLARCYEAALQAFEPTKGRLVNYRQLPDIVWGPLLSDFGVAGTNQEVLSMQAASKFNAKNPGKLFVDETGRKQSRASDEIRTLVDARLKIPYERLESIRRLSHR